VIVRVKSTIGRDLNSLANLDTRLIRSDLAPGLDVRTRAYGQASTGSNLDHDFIMKVYPFGQYDRPTVPILIDNYPGADVNMIS
jgi:hypothetical protein